MLIMKLMLIMQIMKLMHKAFHEKLPQVLSYNIRLI